MVHISSNFGKRLAMLRNEKGLNQEQLAQEFNRISNDGKLISKMAISAYENNSKTPPIGRIILFSKFFDVSVDYLLGLTDVRRLDSEETPLVARESESPLAEPDILIRTQDWKNYHAQCVYVVFPNLSHEAKWGLLDYKKSRVIFTDMVVPLTADLQLYRYQPLEARYVNVSFKQPMNLTRLLAFDQEVWVEMLSSDGFIRGRYNGWYKKDESGMYLINCANSLILRCEGCGVSFNAYTINQ